MKVQKSPSVDMVFYFFSVRFDALVEQLRQPVLFAKSQGEFAQEQSA